MIIAHAYGRDSDAWFTHRNRITAVGGVPSSEAHRSLIECVKDTTSDTSNATALSSECQTLGVEFSNTVVSKPAEAHKVALALDLSQQMGSNPSLRPSFVTYGVAIVACACRRQ